MDMVNCSSKERMEMQEEVVVSAMTRFIKEHIVYANSRTSADSYKGYASLFAADKETSNSPVAIV